MPLTQVSSRAIEDTLRYVLGASGTNHYTFTGKGLAGAVNDPTLTLSRGHTYIFENRSGGHPFYIKTSIANGGTQDAYNTGVTNNGGGDGTEIVFTVPHDAPDLLYYQCSSHSSMAGQLKIAGAVPDGSITTAKLAADAVDGTKIADDAINSEHLVADSIDTEHYAVGSVDTTAIADDAVTADKLANSINTAIAANTAKDLTALSASNLTSGTVPDARFPATLPAVSGANLTGIGGGKILLVLHFRKGDHASSTITGSTSGSTDWNYTGFSPAITPSATSSKIMMVGHLTIGGDSCALYIEVMINGSKTSGTVNGDTNGSRRTIHTSSWIEYDRNATTIPVNYVFSPNSTSTQTYNFRFNHDSSSNKTIYINRSSNASNNLRQGDAVSHITLLEIAGQLVDIPEINLPDTDYILVPPRTIFYPPVAEIPYLDPVLLPSLEQVESGLGGQQSSAEEEKASSTEEALELKPETIPTNLPDTKEILSTEEAIATFNIPFFGEMPIPAPEVIASSVIAAGTASVVSVAGGIAMQSVLAFIKKTFKKMFTKVLKKEIADRKK